MARTMHIVDIKALDARDSDMLRVNRTIVLARNTQKGTSSY